MDPPGRRGLMPGAVECFAHVDVAQARDDALVEQQQLDRGGAAGEAPSELEGIEIERLRPERPERRPLLKLVCPHEVERPEAPGVIQRHAPLVVCLDNEMVVLLDFGRIDAPPARHTKMKDERVAAVRIDQPIFRPPPKSGDARAGQPLPKIHGKRPTEVRAPRFDARDAPALEDAFEAANGRLDFRKLRHAGDMAEARQAR